MKLNEAIRGMEVKGWEKVVNSLLENADVDIYVTGSNSKLMRLPSRSLRSRAATSARPSSRGRT